MITQATTEEEKFIHASFIAQRIGITAQELVGQMPYITFRVDRAGLPAGALLYTNFRETSIEFAAAGDPGWMTKGTVRQMFEFPFVALGVWNLLAPIRRSNRTAREITKSLGFSELCVLPSGGAKGDDIVLYCMHKDKCRWLKGYEPSASPSSKLNGASLHG